MPKISEILSLIAVFLLYISIDYIADALAFAINSFTY